MNLGVANYLKPSMTNRLGMKKEIAVPENTAM